MQPREVTFIILYYIIYSLFNLDEFLRISKQGYELCQNLIHLRMLVLDGNSRVLKITLCASTRSPGTQKYYISFLHF